MPRRDPLASELYSSCALRVERRPLTPYTLSPGRSAHRDMPAKMSAPQLGQPILDETGEPLFQTSLAEHSNRNNGAAGAKDRDQRNCPDGIAEQCRADSHAHSHDEHDCSRNNGNKPVHGARRRAWLRARLGSLGTGRESRMLFASRCQFFEVGVAAVQ